MGHGDDGISKLRDALIDEMRDCAEKLGERIVEEGTVFVSGHDGTLIANAPLHRVAALRASDLREGQFIAFVSVTRPPRAPAIKSGFPHGAYRVKAFLPCREGGNALIQLIAPDGSVADEGPGSLAVEEMPQQAGIGFNFEGSASQESGCWCIDKCWWCCCCCCWW